VPAVLPRKLREVLGEETAQEMAEWVEEVVKERAIGRDEYREVLSRLDMVESRLGRLEEDVRELRRDMNERFDRLQQNVDERFDRLYDRMLVQNRWLVGSIALFGTVVSILLAIGQFVK
jgi:predicted nuclease with TOPRIM domain